MPPSFFSNHKPPFLSKLTAQPFKSQISSASVRIFVNCKEVCNGFFLTSLHVYSGSRFQFEQDLKKRLKRYLDLRTVVTRRAYLSPCPSKFPRLNTFHAGYFLPAPPPLLLLHPHHSHCAMGKNACFTPAY